MFKVNVNQVGISKLVEAINAVLASGHYVQALSVMPDGYNTVTRTITEKDWDVKVEDNCIEFDEDRRALSFSLIHESGVLQLPSSSKYDFKNISCVDSSGDLVISVIPNGTITCSEVIHHLLTK